MIEQAGELRHRIQIVKVVNVQDSEGIMTPSDVSVCYCWAAVKDAGNREFYEAAAQQLEDVVNFVIRWNTDIKPGMVAIHDDMRHEIVQVSRLSHMRDFMQLKTNRKAVIAG
jgi:SPP1 family predicted phage head-tail adaptor